MGVIDSILEDPSGWIGERVLHELAVGMYDDDRRADRSVPGWLRTLIVLLDFDPHVQMLGLLEWWENRGSDGLDDVMAAFRAVALPDQADLLVRARTVLDPRALDGAQDQTPYDVSSFADRHAAIDDVQYQAFSQVDEQLYLNPGGGPGLYAALVAHPDSGLKSLRCRGGADARRDRRRRRGRSSRPSPTCTRGRRPAGTSGRRRPRGRP